MPDQPMQTLVRHIRRMAGDEQDSEQSDRVLLAKFIAQRDENAFAALVQKHGPMVRGVCQRLLGQSPDVDDAFQATFLILVRKASAIRKADSLASWLYGVAYRIARGLRNRIARREVLERQPLQRSVDDPGMQAAWRELCVLLDEEVQRLADKHRAPLVLCYLARGRGSNPFSLEDQHRGLERSIDKAAGHRGRGHVLAHRHGEQSGRQGQPSPRQPRAQPLAPLGQTPVECSQ